MTITINRILLGVCLTGLLGGLTYLGVKAYLSPELLVAFANIVIICH